MKACVALRVPCYSYLVHFFTSGRRITSARFGLEGVGRTSVGHGVGNTKEQNWHRIYSQTLFTQFSSHPYLCLPWMLDIFSINNCTKFFLHLLKDGLRFRNGNIQLWRTSAWSMNKIILKWENMKIKMWEQINKSFGRKGLTWDSFWHWLCQKCRPRGSSDLTFLCIVETLVST